MRRLALAEHLPGPFFTGDIHPAIANEALDFRGKFPTFANIKLQKQQ